MMQGGIGIYRVELELNASLTTNDVMQVTIAQGDFVSNIVTVPVKKAE